MASCTSQFHRNLNFWSPKSVAFHNEKGESSAQLELQYITSFEAPLGTSMFRRTTLVYLIFQITTVSSLSPQTRLQRPQIRLPQKQIPRSSFCSTCSILMSTIIAQPVNAFEGGIGGLGKTKPETGVALWDENSLAQAKDGTVSAEINVNRRPILVRFQSSWPLLPTATGIETRNVRDPESIFVQVVENTAKPSSKNALKQILLESVLSGKGKFGAYGAPIDIKVKATEQVDVYRVSFTTYTPGQRETERDLLVKCTAVADSLLLLVAGTTRQRFLSQEKLFYRATETFEAVATPYRTR